jgi:hypothetical protein
MNINELPEYFAIKRDANNPLWKKYINWLNEKYNRALNGDAQNEYYGYDGYVNYYAALKSFKNPVTELTLEQWDNIVNKKDEFVLPEKWCLRSKGEETYVKYLQPYLEKIGYSESQWNGIDYWYHFDNNKVYPSSINNYPLINYKEITFEQFKKYVLKQDIMKEIIGYKLVKPEYKEAILQIMKARNWSNFPMLDSYESSGSIKTLKEAGVLDLWFEPVYAEEKKLPKINGFEARWENNQIIYGSNCAKFIPKFFIDLIKINDEHKVLGGNRTIKSIKLDSGVEITIEQIKQIQEYVESKN